MIPQTVLQQRIEAYHNRLAFARDPLLIHNLSDRLMKLQDKYKSRFGGYYQPEFIKIDLDARRCN